MARSRRRRRSAAPTRARRAELKHDLEIDGPGLGREIGLTLDPGNTEDGERDLRPGSFDSKCTVGGHERNGEMAALRVA